LNKCGDEMAAAAYLKRMGFDVWSKLTDEKRWAAIQGPSKAVEERPQTEPEYVPTEEEGML
jgi:hypothetical protein